MKVEIGVPDKGSGWGREILPRWKQKIADYFSVENRSADYVYDFGDNWEHIIKLEKILPRDKNINYPICIKGKRACPPEDCGGIWGYENFLEIINDPDNEEYEDMIEWVFFSIQYIKGLFCGQLQFGFLGEPVFGYVERKST